MMQTLSPRHVKTDEALRLGVVSGWYYMTSPRKISPVRKNYCVNFDSNM